MDGLFSSVSLNNLLLLPDKLAGGWINNYTSIATKMRIVDRA
jgi:hypothetical protein